MAYSLPSLAVFVAFATLCSGRRTLSGTALTGFTTVVGPPEFVGGPVPDEFDTAFFAVQPSNETVSYTSNARTYVWSYGPTIDAKETPPQFTGLDRDVAKTSFSYCGKWLNSAWRDAAGAVHGQCFAPLVLVRRRASHAHHQDIFIKNGSATTHAALRTSRLGAHLAPLKLCFFPLETEASSAHRLTLQVRHKH